MSKTQTCCIVIPVYKRHLTKFEQESLKQCVNILGGKYDMYLVCPKMLNTSIYNEIANYDFEVAPFMDSYFKSKETYSSLCTSTVFYNKFKNYDYMLLYQLDGWVFYDKLKYFIDLGYDYIGGPWVIDGVEGVGNGGVSLRKISACLNVVKKHGKCNFFEDQYFCLKHGSELNIAPVKSAEKFALCEDSHNKYFLEGAKTKCPMFAHRINNPNHYDYWQKLITFSDGSMLEEKQHIKYNPDSVTREQYASAINQILNNIKR